MCKFVSLAARHNSTCVIDHIRIRMCELACVNLYHWQLDITRLVSRVVGEPIAESRVVGKPLKQVGKYLYKYQGTPNNVTLPHVGSLGRSHSRTYR